MNMEERGSPLHAFLAGEEGREVQNETGSESLMDEEQNYSVLGVRFDFCIKRPMFFK